jgi:DNA-binding CsgD family transcriptional regulator
MREAVKAQLHLHGISHNETSQRFLIVDNPAGWAIWKLSKICQEQKIVVMSENPCPEYQLDLLEARTHILITSLDNIATVLTQPTMPTSPILSSPLTPSERFILQRTALGHSVSKIARVRNISIQHVKNLRHSVFNKLHIHSHAETTHYYFGNWHILLDQGWTPPLHVAKLSTIKNIVGGGTKVRVQRLAVQTHPYLLRLPYSNLIFVLSNFWR